MRSVFGIALSTRRGCWVKLQVVLWSACHTGPAAAQMIKAIFSQKKLQGRRSDLLRSASLIAWERECKARQGACRGSCLRCCRGMCVVQIATPMKLKRTVRPVMCPVRATKSNLLGIRD